MLLISHFLALLLLPIYVVGAINRTKSIWAGRKGPPLFQLFFDLRRLLQKSSVYSDVSSWIFRLAPWIILSSTLIAGLSIPLLPGFAPISFPFDFVVVAYLFGLGRVFLILGALDTGSSFEGMGASREACFAALAEPSLFVLLGSLSLASGASSFSGLFAGIGHSPLELMLRAGVFVALFIIFQVESARIPVDDPSTHLELTMIHEVMILDHSGPELAALHYASAIKMTLLAALLANLLNPFAATGSPAAAAVSSVVLIVAIAILAGLVESTIARLRLSSLPRYILAGTAASLFSLLVLWINLTVPL